MPVEQVKQSYGTKNLLFKSVATGVLFLVVATSAPLIGPILTFLLLDVLLSAFLYSCFRSKWRILFIIHPFFVLITGYGFQIPFTDIGIAETYVDTYNRFVNPTTIMLHWDELIDALLYAEEKTYGVGKVYASVIPILWFPRLLFDNSPDNIVYFSQSLWALLCISVGVAVGLSLRVVRSQLLFIIALFGAVSPTFLEINSSLHRYHLLVLGLLLFFLAYFGLTREVSLSRIPVLILVLISSIIMIGISKSALFLSLFIFIVLDLWAREKIPVFSSNLKKIKLWLRLTLYIILLICVELFVAEFLVPKNYLSFYSQLGGQFENLINIPIIGLVLRLVYAALSPFPWMNFSQWDLYGYNSIFLAVHVMSSFISVWIILSLFASFRRVLSGPDDIRACVLYGCGIMSSLAYSAIGFHVYLAPALPFLAVLFYEKENRISPVYPIGFIIALEAISQLMQVMRQ